jgi:hypothetical protein
LYLKLDLSLRRVYAPNFESAERIAGGTLSVTARVLKNDALTPAMFMV